MVRRHDADGMPVSEAAASFGFSRPTFYKAQSTLASSGLARLFPQPCGLKQGHKVSAKVVDFVIALEARQPVQTMPQCLAAIEGKYTEEAWSRPWRAKNRSPNLVTAPPRTAQEYERLRTPW